MSEVRHHSGDASIVATVHAFRDPFTEGLKRHDDVSLIKLSQVNQDAVLGSLIDALIQEEPHGEDG